MCIRDSTKVVRLNYSERKPERFPVFESDPNGGRSRFVRRWFVGLSQDEKKTPKGGNTLPTPKLVNICDSYLTSVLLVFGVNRERDAASRDAVHQPLRVIRERTKRCFRAQFSQRERHFTWSNHSECSLDNTTWEPHTQEAHSSNAHHAISC